MLRQVEVNVKSRVEDASKEKCKLQTSSHDFYFILLTYSFFDNI